MRPFDRATQAAGTDVDPVVGPLSRVVDAPFEVDVAEAGIQCLADLRLSIAVAVGEEHDIGCTDNDHAIADRHQPIAGRQSFGPHVRPVHPAVAVGVVQ